MTDLPLSFAPEVAAARDAGRPIVALESTIITHGMPFPQNLEMARQVEQAIRDAGTTEIHEQTEEERAAWVEALQPVYQQMESRIGKDTIDMVRAAAE